MKYLLLFQAGRACIGEVLENKFFAIYILEKEYVYMNISIFCIFLLVASSVVLTNGSGRVQARC